MNANPETGHPSPEEWMDYLYTELPPDRQTGLDGHLRACPTCRAQVDQWRATMAALDTWRLGARRASTACVPGTLRWAIAAAAVLGFGLFLGRLTSPAPGLAKLRAELAAPLRQEFQADLQTALNAADQRTARQLDDLDRTWAAAREEDRQANQALYNRVRTQRQADLAWLRRDLETVAVRADERFDTTERTLGQLASSTLPRPN